MQNTPQAAETDQWNDWLDEYISESMPELSVREGRENAPAASDHTGGWYTGRRKNGAKRRSVTLPSEEARLAEEARQAEEAAKRRQEEEEREAAERAASEPPAKKPDSRPKQKTPAGKSAGAKTSPQKKPQPAKKAARPADAAPRKKAPVKKPVPGQPVKSRPAPVKREEAPAEETPLEYRTITIPIHSGQQAPAPAESVQPRKRKPMRSFYEPAQPAENPEEAKLRNLSGSQFRTLINTTGAAGTGFAAIGMFWALAEKHYLPALLLLAVTLLAGGMLYLVNLYFTKSVIEPIRAITETTRRIAAGSYGVQIEKSYHDEIGELAESINDMSKKISEAERMKSEFISSVSHELRTPLTAINGWGETLLSGQMTDQRDEQKGLSIIVSEAKRLTKMVEELLEFSRIEDGRFVLRIEQIDIKAELEDSVYTYREFFRKKGIDLEYHDCEEEFPPIPGDPERLKQVFSNLLDNAAKHGGSGRKIIVSIFPDNAYVAIRIRDYGAGIPPEELPHVKTKFYKGSSKARGSGIGLAVCDEIAIRHNGSLEIANANGGGCVVTLRLPIHGES